MWLTQTVASATQPLTSIEERLIFVIAGDEPLPSSTLASKIPRKPQATSKLQTPHLSLSLSLTSRQRLCFLQASVYATYKIPALAATSSSSELDTNCRFADILDTRWPTLLVPLSRAAASSWFCSVRLLWERYVAPLQWMKVWQSANGLIVLSRPALRQQRLPGEQGAHYRWYVLLVK